MRTRAPWRLLARVGLAGFEHKPGRRPHLHRPQAAGACRARWRCSRKLLLLDEWLAGLNPSELTIGIDLIRSLKDEGVTILLVEHVMDAIRSLCDRCVVMNSGRKIAEGATGSRPRRSST